MTYYGLRFIDSNTYAKATPRETLTKGTSYRVQRVALKNASFWKNKVEAEKVFLGSRLNVEIVAINLTIKVVK